MAAVAVTRGQIDPRSLLQFQRSLNWVAPNISNQEEFAKNLALIQALGPSKAGRGLFAFEQQWAAGQMSQAAANMAIQFGMIKGGGTAKTNPNIKAKGFGTYVVMPQGWAPGVSEELRKHPQGFALDYLLPHLDTYLEKNIPNFDKMTPKQRSFEETRLGSAIASRDPARAYFGELIAMRGLIDRDVARIKDALKRDIPGLLTAGNPQVQAQAFGQALESSGSRTRKCINKASDCWAWAHSPEI